MPRRHQSQPREDLEPLPERFKGIWIPYLLFDLIRSKVISSAEALLLAEIEATDRTSTGQGPCRYLNEHFAQLLGLSSLRIGSMLSKLVTLQLVKVGGQNNHLRTLRASYDTACVTHGTSSWKQEGAPSKVRGRPLESEGAIKGSRKVPLNYIPPSSTNSPRNQQYHPLTTRLVEIIQSQRKVVSSYRPATWDDEFRRLIETDKVELSRVQSVLEGYARILGKPYVPEAWSARAFREKFARIESAIEREANPIPTHHRPTPIDEADIPNINRTW